MKRDLVMFGIGGLGREALEIAEAMHDRTALWNVLGFLRFATLTHPASVVARRSGVGAGSVVFPGVVIGTQSRI